MTVEMTGSGSPLWLSHHPPDELDRCVVVAGQHVCRRCLLLWPLTFVALALALAGVRWPRSADDLLLVVLPLPAVIEFVLEHAGRWPYLPRLQAVVTVPLAAALGVGFDRYLHHPGDTLFWAVTVVYSAVYALAAFSANRRSPRA
ncbi:MAG: hypothetical protein ACHQNA_06175 [Acidimicrobiales bacterium]